MYQGQIGEYFIHSLNQLTLCYLALLTGTDPNNLLPVISGCPNPLPVIVPVGTTTRVVTWTEPTATDNSGVIPEVTQTHQSGDSFPIGMTEVIYTFTDQDGNSATCSFTITIGNIIHFIYHKQGCQIFNLQF